MKKPIRCTFLFAFCLTLSACATNREITKQTIPQHHAAPAVHGQQISKPLDEEAGKRILTIIALLLMSTEEAGHKQLYEMQRVVPNMLTIVKDYRHCLQTASTQESAVACQHTGWIVAKAKNIDEESLDVPLSDELNHWAEKKSAYLEDLDQQLAQWDKVLPCVENAKMPVHITECLDLNK